MAPKSLMPLSRLIADIHNPPTKPIRVIASDISPAAHQLNGVTQYKQIPISTEDKMPPTKPSMVLFGLNFGTIGCLPNNFPNTYCSTSESCVTTIKNSSSLTFSPHNLEYPTSTRLAHGLNRIPRLTSPTEFLRYARGNDTYLPLRQCE